MSARPLNAARVANDGGGNSNHLHTMNTADTIKAAINRRCHNETVEVAVTWPIDSRSAEETIIDIMDGIDGLEDPDTAQANDGSYDVWGKLNGADFRIRVITADK